MNIIENFDTVDPNIKRGIALGNFDGIHIGHQKLIHTLIEKSEQVNLKPCVYTFKNHPISVITGGNPPPQITDLRMKKKIFESLGIDTLFLAEFNKRLMALSPEDFVKDVLVAILNCKIAVVGFDYRFGHKAKGDVNLLKKLGRQYGFEVHEVFPVKLEDEKVSSTKIREYISNGEIEKANFLLGRYYAIESKVIHGKGRGNKLGYPTANTLIDYTHLIPKIGVYATIVKIDGKAYMGATCVGTNPTFGLNDTSIETFILDYEGSLYDQIIEISFVKKLREQIKFENIEGLIKQMEEDVLNTKKHLQDIISVLK